jgi:hypothetical protein
MFVRLRRRVNFKQCWYVVGNRLILEGFSKNYHTQPSRFPSIATESAICSTHVIWKSINHWPSYIDCTISSKKGLSGIVGILFHIPSLDDSILIVRSLRFRQAILRSWFLMLEDGIVFISCIHIVHCLKKQGWWQYRRATWRRRTSRVDRHFRIWKEYWSTNDYHFNNKPDFLTHLLIY